MNISVVVPSFNEAESIPELYEWIVRVMKAHTFTYEIILWMTVVRILHGI